MRRAHASTQLSRAIPSTLGTDGPAGKRVHDVWPDVRRHGRSPGRSTRLIAHHSAARGWQSLPSTAPAQGWRQMEWLRRLQFSHRGPSCGRAGGRGSSCSRPGPVSAQRVERGGRRRPRSSSAGVGARAPDRRGYPPSPVESAAARSSFFGKEGPAPSRRGWSKGSGYGWAFGLGSAPIGTGRTLAYVYLPDGTFRERGDHPAGATVMRTRGSLSSTWSGSGSSSARRAPPAAASGASRPAPSGG